MKVYVLHENPDWYPPFAAAFDAEGVPHEPWLLGDGSLELADAPPPGVFWSRMSASAHTRGHVHAKDHTRAVLSWLAAAGRRVVNGRRVLELEMSKVDQLTALRAAGFDVPRTIAIVNGTAGTSELLAAAGKLPTPLVVKHNQGGKGLGVRRFDSVDELATAELEPPVDGITLVQEYVRPAQPFITRVEVVGGELVYAITADVARGGFELCPADACATGGGSLFALREGFDEHPIVARYLEFARRHGIEIAGFEFIETVDGRLVTYDINTNTNYNPEVEAVAPRSGPRMIARFLAREAGL
ncbi:MAG TPA: hypothetical protein VFV67_17815 [Actinophytocola sp.]|uniref:ATP-grasp domain-containing protein n=1 Tax=Actinophytocola sp. TaxID=1872138 RepID=UPI002DB64A8D|nr:hypothetical protein [Actinophytocola sp.]HEU5472509.1 hypothetical protein [Actinophytocola sp.]